MHGLFARPSFAGFGPSAFDPAAPSQLTIVEGSRPSALRSKVRLTCPRRPGVYGMLDDRGEVIYVGKAKCLRSRLLSYFRPKSRDPKAGAIVREARRVVWEHVPTEFAALLRELELIRRWQPRFNVAGQPRRKRRTFVCLGRRPAPYVYLTPRPAPTALAWFGPVPASLIAREAVRRVNDWFGLRDCPTAQEMVFRDQQELFPVVRTPGCLRMEIGHCLGPCAAGCSRDEYEARARAALVFLEGRDPTPLTETERAMHEAAASHQFERAGALRDKWAALAWLHEHLDRLRRARGLSFVYPLRGHGGEKWWYLIHRGQVRAVLSEPDSTAEKRDAASLVEKVYAERTGALEALASEWLEGALLVEAWFRCRAEERTRVLTCDEALARLK